MEQEPQHISVLLDEVVEYLKPQSIVTKEANLDIGNGDKTTPYIIYDATLGGAGHSKALLDSNPRVFVVGVDRDSYALSRAAKVLSQYSSRIHLSHGVFSDIEQHLAGVNSAGSLSQAGSESAQKGKTKIQCDAMLVDLGVSSFQFDIAERGFSFRQDAPLDMRMDSTQKLSAQNVVNDYELGDLKRVLLRGGVGASSLALARAIVNNRPVSSTKQLADICESSLKSRRRESKAHQATVVFQAIRIEVNDELGEIERFLERVPANLAPGGTLAVISFHSAEDKLVAAKMRNWSRAKQPLKEVPQADQPALGALLTKRALTPDEEEISHNPRSRSALLRVFRRNTETSNTGII